MINAILPVNKPCTWTSADVVRKIKYAVKPAKVGHAGTLDPFADGLLIVLIGKMTKQSDAIMAMPKVYEGIIQLGKQTDTGDIDGQVVEEKPIPSLQNAQILEALKAFEGEISQLPPKYSALKVNGKKMYELARKGVEFERRPRQVLIHSIDLLGTEPDKIRIRVKCGKGTYIRVLAEDIAEKLGTVGHLCELTRSAVGEYRIQDALELDNLKQWISEQN